jgi:hypothetical protein
MGQRALKPLVKGGFTPPQGGVHGGGKQQQPADDVRVQRELDPMWLRLEARQSGDEAPVVPGAAGRRGHAQQAVPGLDGVDRMREYGQGGAEGETVPDVGPEEVVRHGEQQV